MDINKYLTEQTDFDLSDKIDKLNKLSSDEQLKMIYQWIKTGHVTLKEYVFIHNECLIDN